MAEHGRQTIAIGGFMGVGKSTVGPLVARGLGWRFVDLDAVIEERTGHTCSTLLRGRGEPAFRSEETQALEDVLAQGLLVVSLGGGTLHEPANRALLANARVVVLWAPLEELLPRLSGPGRPLAKDAAVLFAQRWEGYHSTGSLVDVSGCSPQEAATRVLARLEAA